MRVAILSDVHGNSVALANCLHYLDKIDIDKVYFLGDAIGYMPWAEKVVDLLQGRKVHCLKGNHEAMFLGQLVLDKKKDIVYRLSEAAERLSQKHKDYIATWSESERFEADGKKYLLVHGSPFDYINGYVYPDTDLKSFNQIDEEVVIMGHTHRPFLREFDGKLMVNVGSVGLPRDVGNLSCFCIINSEPFGIEHIRIAFDTDQFELGQVDNRVLACFERRTKEFIGSENVITDL